MSELPALFHDVARWYAATTVALGIRTGLVQALLDAGGTAQQLAAASRTDADNAARWGDAMVAAGYATKTGDRYAPIEETLGLLRGGTVMDVPSIVELLAPAGALLPTVEQAMRDGGGIPSATFQATLGALPEQVNVPLYRTFLVEEWIGGFPELEASLRAGIDVAEIGPGGGEAMRLLAQAFPASRFTGIDLDPLQVDRANAAAQAAGMENLRFAAADGGSMAPASVDLVCIFDAFHHVTDPDPLVAAVRAAIRPGGSLLLAEPALTGDPTQDAADPTAIILYGSDLIYCYQESKTAGRPGMGTTWAGRALDGYLAANGFREAGRVISAAGYAVIRAVPTAG